MLKFLKTEVEINDYPISDNYIIDHFIAYFDTVIGNNPDKRGHHLNNFVEEFSPNWTDDPEINQHIEEDAQYMQAKVLGSEDNIKHIILDWFDATVEEKELAIKKVLWYKPKLW